MQPDRVVRSTCPYCGVGCQVDLQIRDERIIRVDAPIDATPNYGRLCVKGRFGTDFLHHPGRLTQPLIRRLPVVGRRTPATGPEDWRITSWEEALDLVVQRLVELRQRHGPHAITANACAKATNEDNYLLQKYIRAVIGTNNIDHCTRLCHAASVVALQMAIGSSAMSNSIGEMKDLECFIITGSNTGENHPVIATFLKQAVRKNGARLIVIDPRQTEMTHFAELWLRQRPGTDVALFTAMARVIIDEGLINQEFLDRRTEGLDELRASLVTATPEWAAEITGVPADEIRAAARLYAGARSAAIYWGMGISQSSHGTDNALALINLALLCGHIGRLGTGLNPLRGQNNVQGCSDVGGIPGFYTAYQPISDPAVRHRFEQAWGVSLPDQLGLTTTEMVDGILTGQVKAWYVMGENPLMSEPDLNHARHAVEQLEFFVSQDIFFNESNVYADIILPAAAFAEKDGTYTNSDRRIQRGRRAVAGPGESRADWQIIAELARRTLAALGRPAGDEWNVTHPSAVWDEIRRVTPEFDGITYERLEREGGVHWPCPTADHPGSPYLFADDFPRGRARLWPVIHSLTSEALDEEYPFTLSTGRILYHWHGGTLTRASALNKIWPECAVELHPHDAARLGLATNDWVTVASRRGSITARLLVTGRSPEGVVFIPFHFVEAAANTLTDGRLDLRAKIPDFKVCSVRITRSDPITTRPGADISLTDRGTIKDPLPR